VSERAYQMRSGPEILEALDKASKGLQAASTELSELSQGFHEAHIDENGEIVMGVGLQFDTSVRDEVAFLYTNAMDNGVKPPPADVREALALKAVQIKKPQLWVEYHRDKARIDALQSWVRNQRDVISANQSLRRAEAA
jgi:hypothetical protein